MDIRHDYQQFIPAEVLKKVFALLDPHTLVTYCRSVCKFWKQIVESPDVWKIQVRHMAIRNEAVDSILPIASEVYPWYLCYALCKNIFGVNLFPREIHGGTLPRRPTYWETDEFRNTGGVVCPAPINSDLLGFSLPPQELLDEGIDFCLLASIEVSTVNHTIDLYERGFTKKILEFKPPIFISEWYAIRHNLIGLYRLQIILFNSEWVPDFENGVVYYYRRSERTDWQNVTHTFINYRTDVRYVFFHHGVEIHFHPYRPHQKIDSRDPGSKLAGSKLIIYPPGVSGPPSSV